MGYDKVLSKAGTEMANARSRKLSPARRKEIASLAASAKWAGKTAAERKKAVVPANKARKKAAKARKVSAKLLAR